MEQDEIEIIPLEETEMDREFREGVKFLEQLRTELCRSLVVPSSILEYKNGR